MDEEYRLSIPRLFARWAGENFRAWQQAIGVSVTHLSRGNGRVTDVMREGGIITVHVQYAKAVHEHPLCELRTEFIQMTLPTGLTRDGVIATVKARRLLHEQDAAANRDDRSVKPHGLGGDPTTQPRRKAGVTGTDEAGGRTGTRPE